MLKAQAFSLSAALPGQLQVQVGTVAGLSASAAAQLADLDALISAMETRNEELQAAIVELSQRMLSGEGYSFLTVTVPISGPLSTAVARDYPRLFDLGYLAGLPRRSRRITPWLLSPRPSPGRCCSSRRWKTCRPIRLRQSR